MKKIFTFLFLVLHIVLFAQSQCNVFILPNFDSQCILTDYIGKPDILSDCNVVCKNSTVTYTAGGTDGTYSWEVLGANPANITQQGNSCTVYWDYNADTGTVKVTLTTSDGNVCSSELCVALIDSPQEGAKSDPAYIIIGDKKMIEVCIGTTITFTDNSSGTLITNLWKSEYGITNAPIYEITPMQAGDFVVEHRVMNYCGCEDVEYYFVKVNEAKLTFDLSCYGTVCDGSTHTYTLIEPHCSNYQWLVSNNGEILPYPGGQGTPQITVKWDDSEHIGYGTISLDLSDCEVDAVCSSNVIRIPIISDNVEISGPDIVCVGDKAVYDLPLWGSTKYIWTITPSSNVEHHIYKNENSRIVTFYNSGTYTISVKYYNDFLDCGSNGLRSLTKTVIVKPKLEITPENSTICNGESQTFTTNMPQPSTWRIYNNSNQIIYNSIGTNLTYTFNSSGIYKITAENEGACNTATSTVTVSVPPPPLPLESIIGAHAVCFGGSIDLSATPTNPMYTLIWEAVCQEGQERGYNVTIHYISTVCDIKVYQRDVVTGCLSEPTIYHVVELVPATIDTSPRTVCAGDHISLFVPYQEGILYKWSVFPIQYVSVNAPNNPDVSILANTVAGLSSYTATVKLRREYCGHIIEDNILLNINSTQAPTVSVLPANICQDGTVTFTANGGNGTYSWSFDDGTVITGNPVNKTFTTPGQHSYTLTYTPISGCSPVTNQRTVFVNNLPDGTITSYTSNSTLFLTVPIQDNVSYKWFYNNGTTPIGTNPTIAVTGYGEYCCELKNTITGCTTRSCIDINSNPPPECIEIPLTKVLTDCNTYKITADNPIYPQDLSWTISPSLPANSITPALAPSEATAVFGTTGYFSVAATANVDEQCYLGSVKIVIDYVLKMEIELMNDCNSIKVYDNSIHRDGYNMPNRVITITGEGVSLSQTLIGSQNSATFNNITANISVPTLCTVSMSVGNCTVTKTFTLYPLPVITSIIAPAQYCENTPVVFQCTGTNISSVLWGFGDNTYITGGNSVYHNYAYRVPLYTVTVTAYNSSSGCSTTASKQIQILKNDMPQLNQDNLTYSSYLKVYNPKVCRGNPRTINWTGIPPLGSTYHYSWNPLPTTDSPLHTVYQSGNYSVTVTSDIGCVCQGQKQVDFYNIPTAIILGETSYCFGETVNLYGDAGEDVQYQWSVTGPQSYFFDTPDISFMPFIAGTYNVTLTVSNSNGCSATASKEITVFPQPEPLSLQFAYENESRCIDTPPVCITTTSGRDDVYWSNGYIEKTACFYTDGYVSAYYIDENGCSSQTSFFYICPKPNFDALLTGCYDLCREKDLHIYDFMTATIMCSNNHYDWYVNGAGVQNGNFSEDDVLPLSLPGIHVMTVKYGANCFVTSPPLIINKVEKCCQSSYKRAKVNCYVRGEKLFYDITVTICNTGDIPLDLDNLLVNDAYTVEWWGNNPLNIEPNKCEDINITVSTNIFTSSSALFTLIGKKNNCFVDFSVLLDPNRCICKSSVEVLKKYCFIEDGKLFYKIDVNVCNSGTTDLDFNNLSVNDGFIITSCTQPLIVPAGNCKMLQITLMVNDFTKTSAQFTIFDEKNGCITIFSVPIDWTDCKCNIEVEVVSKKCFTDGCNLSFDMMLKVCNAGTTYLNLDNCYVSSGYEIWHYTPVYIPPGGCADVHIVVDVKDFTKTSALFTMFDKEQGCITDFSVPLDWRDCIKEECKFEKIHFEFSPEYSDYYQKYFKFEILLPNGTTDLLSIWVEPPKIFNFNYNPTQFVDGIFMFDYYTLRQMALNNEDVCIYAVVCIENKYLCLVKHCIPAGEFFSSIRDTSQIPAPNNISTSEENGLNSIIIYPNPVKDQLTINNEQLIINNVDICDITGKTILTPHSSFLTPHSSFLIPIDVSTLPQGIYLIKIYTENGVTIEKFIKK